MFAGKEVRVFMKGQAKEAYLELKDRKDKESTILINSIDRVKDILKENPQFGDPIRKKQIPAELGIKNLFRVELSLYWRLLYTINGTDIEIILFILRIDDHKSYDKLFRY